MNISRRKFMKLLGLVPLAVKFGLSNPETANKVLESHGVVHGTHGTMEMSFDGEETWVDMGQCSLHPESRDIAPPVGYISFFVCGKGYHAPVYDIKYYDIKYEVLANEPVSVMRDFQIMNALNE